ncbi:MAG TPA: hypothetical protein VLH40_04235 [Atribacteraceae bacterium]|nr:hypothetical protein [Atribacteraceae bacterium]
MRVHDIIEPLQAEILVDANRQREITGGYCGDLLSDCIANAFEGCVWVTIQSHPNIVAVAVLTDMAAVVIANSQEHNEQTLAKARQEGVVLLRTAMTSYQAVAVLSGLGIPGARKHR